MSDVEGLRIIMKAQDIIDLRAKVTALEEEIAYGQKNLDHAWAEVDRLKGLLSIALEAESNANARLTDLEDLLLTTLHEADCRQCQRFTSSGLCNSITVCENGNRFISAPFFLLYRIKEVAFND